MVAGSENAFFSLKREDLDDFRTDNSSSAKAIIFLINKPKVLLATILITNNFINIAFVIVSEWLFKLVLTEAVIVTTYFFVFQVVFVTFIIVFLAEITPKIYATQNYLSFSKLVAVPMLYLSRMWKPFVWILVKSTSVIDKRITKRGHELTVDDLEHAIDLTSNDESPEEEKEVLKNIVNFGNIEAKQIMRSRLDVKAIDIETSFEDLLKLINEWEYSRMPVYEETFDHVKGILNIKDLLPLIYKSENFSWQSLIREPFYVPQTKKIDDLLKEFQTKRVHMAIVVDEYGGSSGIVTMEDILEEIFGEINDEFDDDEITYTQLDEQTFIFEGKMLINDICRLMDIRSDAFDDIRGEADTLGGLILEIAGRIPSVKEKINFQDFVFTIEAADKRSVKRIKVEQINAIIG
ncbi:MAG: gliding motility-associated protein GldE [Bacteroidetes bacterium]|nr:gliding motility-associated protein GldE [Bacteroidota bacterium]